MSPRARTLLVFALGGLALLAARRSLESPERPRLLVRIPSDLDGLARERLIDEAVLVEVGLALGWRTDPLVRDRLERTIARLAPSPAPALDRAAALDLPRKDPLVRARLAERARRTLPEPGTPGDVVLEAFVRDHAERFARPPTLTFEHRFTTDPDRAATLESDPDDRGEPELTLGPRPTRTLPALTRTLGPDATRALADAPLGQWVHLTSPLGHHLVRLLERRAPSLPTLAEIHGEVLAAWRDAARVDLQREAMHRLRAGFDLIVEPTAPIPTEASR